MPPEQACGKVRHEKSGLGPYVEERVEFGQIQRSHEAAVMKDFHDEMRFAECCATADRRTNGRCNLRVEEIDVEADMQPPVRSPDTIEKLFSGPTIPCSSMARMSKTVMPISATRRFSAGSTDRIPIMHMLRGSTGRCRGWKALEPWLGREIRDWSAVQVAAGGSVERV